MRKSIMCLALAFIAIKAAPCLQPGGSREACEALARAALPHTEVLSAAMMEPGMLLPPVESKSPVFANLPAFCRVVAMAHPSADSQIKIETWLPAAGWNGRFLGQGNGGFAGYIDYDRLAGAILHGYASAGTDTGHTTGDAVWALGHPEKLIDYGYRGLHEMTLTGLALTQAFYGRAASHRYFASCSNGGREALMEAQRFPADYDGILAGAPAYNWTHLVGGGVSEVKALFTDPASYIPPAKVHALAAAVLARCGNAQGFVDDPRTCHFDPAALQCKGAETGQCLTAAQAAAVRAVYAGAHTSDGKPIWPGMMPGAEDSPGGWVDWITGSAPGKSAGLGFVQGYFADMVYGDPNLDAKALNQDDALNKAVAVTGAAMDAVNPDLSAFSGRGGKLILYHGWNDPAISALGTVAYYNQVVAAAGQEQAAGFVRLYMAPGMLHCVDGPGLASFGQVWSDESLVPADPGHNIYLALEAWVEKGTAPGPIVAEHIGETAGNRRVAFSRPLCAYPQVATYKGSGDRNQAASYACSAEK
jgi:feruloyl esterase